MVVAWWWHIKAAALVISPRHSFMPQHAMHSCWHNYTLSIDTVLQKLNSTNLRNIEALFLRNPWLREEVDLVGLHMIRVGVLLETAKRQRTNQPLRFVEQALAHVHVRLVVLGRTLLAEVFEFLQ